MIAQKLRNIFVVKYIPLFRSLGVQVEEDTKTEQLDGVELKSFFFNIGFVVDENSQREWTVYFSDVKSGDTIVTEMFLSAPSSFRRFSEKLSANDWRFFYGRLNGLVARVLAPLVAKSLGTTAWNARVRLPNGKYAYIKFTLRKIHIEAEVGDSEKVSAQIDVDLETDMVAKLSKSLALLSL